MMLYQMDCALSDRAQFIVENIYAEILPVKYSCRASRSLQFIYIF